jgi:ATP-dependent Clp protease protease subunit
MSTPTPSPQPRSWYSFRNEASDDGSVELEIYAEIGESFWWESVSATEFVRELNAVTADRITLRINSPGGSVFDGIAIYNALRRHKAHITVHVDALAASIASVIMLAGDHIIVNEGAIVMIHNPSTIAWGEASDLRETADLLDKLRDQILEIYVSRTGQSVDDLTAWMEATTWMSGTESVERGFANEAAADVVDDEKLATASFDQRNLKLLVASAPTHIAARLMAPAPPKDAAPAPAPAETSTPESVDTKPAASTEHDMRVRHLLATR